MSGVTKECLKRRGKLPVDKERLIILVMMGTRIDELSSSKEQWRSKVFGALVQIFGGGILQLEPPSISNKKRCAKSAVAYNINTVRLSIWSSLWHLRSPVHGPF